MSVSRRDPRAEEEESADDGLPVDRVGDVPTPRRPASEPPPPATKTATLPPPAQESPAGQARFDARADPLSLPPAAGSPGPEAEPPSARSSGPPPPRVSAAPRVEPRLIPLDRMINDNDWRAVAKELGPPSAGALPPTLALLAAIAHRETSEAGGQDSISVGVDAVAALLGLPPDGAIAGVVARRLLRTNPVRFRDRKAPPARISILIVLLTLVVGGTVGWLLSGGWIAVRNLFR